MNSRIGSKLAWLAALAAMLLAGAAPAAELIKMRMGNHPTYTRVVFELDESTGYRFEKRDGEIIVTLDAISQPRRVDWKTVMVKDLAVEPQGQRAVARIELKKTPSRVREMMLAKPPRIVLDLVFPAADIARVRARAKALEAEKARKVAAAEKVLEAAPEATSVAPRAKPAVASTAKPAVASTAKPAVASTAKPAVASTAKPAVVVSTKAGQTPSAKPAKPKATQPLATAKADAETDAKGAKPAPGAKIEPKEAKSASGAKADSKVAKANERPDPVRRSAVTRPEEKPVVADSAKPAARVVARADAARADAVRATARRRSSESKPAPTATPSESSQAASESGDSDVMLWGGIAAGLLVLVVAVMAFRRRSALPNDLDVTAVAEEQSRLDATPDGGFAMGAAPAGEEEAERFSAAVPYENPMPEPQRDPAPIETRPVEVDIAAGPGLFDEDDPEKESETMDLERQALPTAQTASELPTQIGIGAADAGESDIARLVRDLERRVVQLETRLDESTDARERLERQMAAQAEELRVQRAAIARTQRALRSLNRPGDEQATEPALRDPS